MASIQKHIGKNGNVSWRVAFKSKNKEKIFRTFSDQETALIWVKYQEMVTNEMRDFNVDPNDMYTIVDVLIAKYGEESREFKSTITYFKGIGVLYLGGITYDMMIEHAKKLLRTKVLRGGSIECKSGHKKLPEIMTILRKFAHLSSAINFMIKNGTQLENHAIKVVCYLRAMHKKEKNEKANKPD